MRRGREGGVPCCGASHAGAGRQPPLPGVARVENLSVPTGEEKPLALTDGAGVEKLRMRRGSNIHEHIQSSLANVTCNRRVAGRFLKIQDGTVQTEFLEMWIATKVNRRSAKNKNIIALREFDQCNFEELPPRSVPKIGPSNS